MRSRTKRRSRQGRPPRRGAAAVEFAIVLPLIFLILVGAIDVGQSIHVSQVVNEASREGARQASRYDESSEAAVAAAVRDYIRGSYPGVGDGSIAVSMTQSDGTSVASGDLTTVTSGTPLTVQVDLQYSAVRWTVGFPGLTGASIVKATSMRRE